MHTLCKVNIFAYVLGREKGVDRKRALCTLVNFDDP